MSSNKTRRFVDLFLEYLSSYPSPPFVHVDSYHPVTGTKIKKLKEEV
jgi:hypothetical protein